MESFVELSSIILPVIIAIVAAPIGYAACYFSVSKITITSVVAVVIVAVMLVYGASLLPAGTAFTGTISAAVAGVGIVVAYAASRITRERDQERSRREQAIAIMESWYKQA